MSKELNTSFTYTITDYDTEKQRIRVEYGDGSWAQIDLVVPLPETREDLEAVIAQFTAPMEHEMAISQDEPCSLIQDMVGKSFDAERRYASPPDPVVNDELGPEAQAQAEDLIGDIIGTEVKRDDRQ
jgi:hypothetical protein